MAVIAGITDTIFATREKMRGKIGQTKVNRYWPGKAPEWADEPKDDGDTEMTFEKAFFSLDSWDIARKEDDARLRRLADSRADNREEVRADHRLIRQAEIVSSIEEENSRLERMEFEYDDEDALEERRRRIREKYLLRQQEEAVPQEEENTTEEEEESEYESESEVEETTGGIAMVKPVFVLKSDRDTIEEREKREAEKQALKELVKKKLEERKLETKQIVVEKIREEETVRKNLELNANIADVDTDDEMNEAEEYEAWKSREIARIKREREEKEKREKEQQLKKLLDKLRNMTEEERKEWEMRNPKPAPPPKHKRKFMQRYYHKGAFFQSDPDDSAGTSGADSIYRRDFSAPTGDDKLDKSILPKVMQVKHFGRSGRTKWTHLVNEDTTDWNNPWTYNGSLRDKYNARMAAMNAPIAKPMGRKLKDWRVEEAVF